MGSEMFEVGPEEKELLKIAKLLQNKISDKEWNEIAASSKIDTYSIVKGDYLWQISKKYFGSGFYYAKLWSLNSYIRNPHEVEPGMILVFDTGSSMSPPKVQIGKLADDATIQKAKTELDKQLALLSQYGDDVVPGWLMEKRKLLDSGIFVEQSSEYTENDLIGKINFEYEKYSLLKTSY